MGVGDGKPWRGGDGKQTTLLEGLSLLSRVVPASYFSIVCYGFWKSFLQTGKWTSLFWMMSEGIIVLLLVIRKRSVSLSVRPWDWLVAIGGSFCILLVRPSETFLLPDLFGFALQLIGTLFEIYGKAALGKSFGIVAANRGIVLTGPYRMVRHPIYLGYLITHIGFLLSNWSGRNLAVYSVSYCFQIARIFSEERLLLEEPSYREYCTRVRYRLVPGVF